MKKSFNYFLSFFALSAILFLASCGEDGELPIPGDDEITLTSNSIENDTLRGFPGDTVYVVASLGIGSDGEITAVSDDNSVAAVQTPNTISSGDSITVIIPEGAPTDAMATLTFTSGSINEQLVVKVEYDNSIAAVTYQTVLLQTPTGARTSETFFSAINGMTYTANEVINGPAGTSDSIDFGYYYGQTNEASLASPSTYPSNVYDLGPNGFNWGTRNETMFLPTNNLSAEDFEAIADDQGARLVQEYEVAAAAGTPTAEITQLAVNQTYSFLTQRGQHGILRIDEINPGIEADRSITITVKVTPAVEEG